MCAFGFLLAWTDCLRGGNHSRSQHRGIGHRRRRRRSRQRHHNAHPLFIPGPVPIYQVANRDACPLLQACWDQDWTRVSQRCRSHPHEAFVQSAQTLRTALHLATMPGGAKCPWIVLKDLIAANPHAVIVSDRHQYGGTPLHFACGSAFLRNDPASIQLLVDTALRVQEDELSTAAASGTATTAAVTGQVRISHWSPLFLAAKWAAPCETLDILVQAAGRQVWIGPWTGGESKWQISNSNSEIRRHASESSPLEALWLKVASCFEDDFNDYSKLLDDTLPTLRKVAEMLLNDVHHFPNLSSCIPSPSTSSLPAPGKSSSSSSSLHQNDDDKVTGVVILDAWTKLVILLRHDAVSNSTTLLNTVAGLHRPIPGLVRLVCRVFPESMLQHATFPIQHHQQEQTLHNTHWKDDDEPAVYSSLNAHEPQQQRQDGNDQPEMLYYPALLACSHDAPIDIIFHLLVSAPLVLELQRQSFRRPELIISS